MGRHAPFPSAGDPADAAVTLRRGWAKRLLDWFAANRRDLPWRRDRDPYRIWVSEVMLQQTVAATVVPYFEHFLQAFPTLTDLAAADEQDVLRLWEGLGYYRRARDLLRTARVLAATNGGRFPNDPKSLHGLPGLGRYTRNAVLSQAFDQRLPILEANSVACWPGCSAAPATRAAAPNNAGCGPRPKRCCRRAAPAISTRLLWSQGALVCTPQSPRCGECPLAKDCVARWLGLQAVVPARVPAREPTLVREAAVVVRRGKQVLLLQRPPDGRWASLWEFPHASLAEGETSDDGAAPCFLS